MRWLLGSVLCATAVSAQNIVVIQNVAVPMRDGVILRADLYRPPAGGSFPVLVYRTPYGKKETSTVRHAVERGYAVLVEDVRGRYASDGEFNPYAQEPDDGYDTIEWAARQPWSNGAVGMFGLSYPGAVQWFAAIENPPHLKAIVPAMTFSTPQNFFYAGGTWDMSWLDWIWLNIAPDARRRKHLAGPTTRDSAGAAWSALAEKMDRELPLDSVAELRDIAPYYYEWLRHPPEDRWWNWAELRDKYPRVHAAVLNLSAWYDDNYGPEGATTNFAGLIASRTGERDPRTHLLLGPWTHGGQEDTTSGDRTFPASSTIDYDEVVLRWLDRYVRGLANGVDTEPRVRYYVMGSNVWRTASHWPPAARPVTYFLAGASGRHEGGAAPGLLTVDSANAGDSTTFIADPNDPVVNSFASSGAHDYAALGARGDVLTFETPPLTRDVEVTGFIHATIYLVCDCRDTDVWVRLLDVRADARALNLMSPGLDVQRVSYRDTTRGRQLLTPGHVYEVQLDHLITSNVFARGDRIRVQISTTFFPNFSRNPQTGESEATSAHMQRATVAILHRPGAWSRIVLPIVRETP